jgi:nucleotide-binding universal stress UspA family protein
MMTEDQKYSSLEEMLRDARKPQRIDGPTAGVSPTSHLVIGFDACPSSHRALRFAIDLAAPLAAYLHVAHVIDLDDFPIDPDSADWEKRFLATLNKERTEACDLLAVLPGNWTYYARGGNPAHVLASLADAHDAMMIIIGTSRGGLISAIDRVLGESVSSHLIRHTHRPVVLVPDDTSTPRAPAEAGQ